MELMGGPETQMKERHVRRNWLITGGCGFIGAALAARLIGEGQAVRALDNLSASRAEALPGERWNRVEAGTIKEDWAGAELMVADIRDANAVSAAACGADVIVHLAANTGVLPSVQAPLMDCEVNVIGTLNCLEAARDCAVRRFVLASSGAPLGKVQPPLREDSAPRPISPYGASKLAGEGYCSAYHGTFGVDTVALRFGNVYGPGSDHKQSVIAKYIRRALAGEPLHIYGDGSQTRDFIYIDDIVDALTRAATTPGIGGELFQIASSREHTVSEVALTISRLVETRCGQHVIIDHTDALPFEVRRNYSDITKARAMMGFQPRTEFETGLSKTLEYFIVKRDSAMAIANLALE